jgi:spore coat polysaccharide biosynthesis protein SpsF
MILAILQARFSSTRLPGKVLKPILGRPMLARHIERLRRCRKIDGLMVATSVDPSDDAIEALCGELDIPCFRGSLPDVLDRYYRAAMASEIEPEHIVRVTGDCPLADPELIDRVIEFHLDGGYDYSCNARDPFTFPDGLDVEVFRAACLERAWREATLPSQREHVTPFVYQHPEWFKIGDFKNTTDLSHLRWTVDEPADFELVRRIYEALYPANPAFTTPDILDYLEVHPELKTLNVGHQRNEGFQKSLEKDRQSGQD